MQEIIRRNPTVAQLAAILTDSRLRQTPCPKILVNLMFQSERAQRWEPAVRAYLNSVSDTPPEGVDIYQLARKRLNAK
ncbi:MAG TPA: hypothetical protein VGL72_10915 [Bryobacteraceae bacterium]|jgi:hypothetical protein